MPEKNQLSQDAEGFDVPTNDQAAPATDQSQAAPVSAAATPPVTAAGGGTVAAPTPRPAPKSDEEEFAEEVKSSLPPGLNESFEVLKQAEAMPETTVKEQKMKEIALRVVKAHCFALQQTPAAPPISADAEAVTYQNDYATRRHTRMELLGRQNRDVRELLDQITALESENAELKALLKLAK